MLSRQFRWHWQNQHFLIGPGAPILRNLPVVIALSFRRDLISPNQGRIREFRGFRWRSTKLRLLAQGIGTLSLKRHG